MSEDPNATFSYYRIIHFQDGAQGWIAAYFLAGAEVSPNFIGKIAGVVVFVGGSLYPPVCYDDSLNAR